MGVETPTSSVQLGSELVNVSLSRGSHRAGDCDQRSVRWGDEERERELAVVRQGDWCPLFD